MSDFKFACPQCQQHIACGPEYFGRQINCPACGTAMQVPNANPAVSAAPRSPTPLIPQPPSLPKTGIACPSCSAPLAAGAVICTACGFNLQTRQKVQPQRTPGAKRPGTAAAKDEKWYATPYPYLGLYVVVMMTFYILGRSNEGMQVGFFGMAGLYWLGITITVLVAAFKDSAMKGILCLICGIYALYWVYSESDSTFLKVAYSVNILIALAFKFARLES